jgi:hypothetical protein
VALDSGAASELGAAVGRFRQVPEGEVRRNIWLAQDLNRWTLLTSLVRQGDAKMNEQRDRDCYDLLKSLPSHRPVLLSLDPAKSTLGSLVARASAREDHAARGFALGLRIDEVDAEGLGIAWIDVSSSSGPICIVADQSDWPSLVKVMMATAKGMRIVLSRCLANMLGREGTNNEIIGEAAEWRPSEPAIAVVEGQEMSSDLTGVSHLVTICALTKSWGARGFEPSRYRLLCRNDERMIVSMFGHQVKHRASMAMAKGASWLATPDCLGGRGIMVPTTSPQVLAHSPSKANRW